MPDIDPALVTGETLVIHSQASEVLANVDDRTLTVLLVPYGEVGRTNAGRIIVQAGDIALPDDPMIVGLNLDHARDQSVGRAATVWEEPRGIMATYAVAKGAKGDAALADARDPNGKRRAVSGEFNIVLGELDPTTNARRCRPGLGELFGGALVERGAFDSALVLAADTSSRYVTEYTDAEGVTWRRVETTTTETTETDTGIETTSVTTVTETTEGDPNMADEPTTTPVAATAVAPIPSTVNTATPAATTQPVNETAQVLAALNALRTNPRDGDALQVLAAITDVTMSGTNTLPGTNVLRPNWLGKLYQGIPYFREYAPLLNLGTDISAAGKMGMRVFRGTAASPLGPQDGTWPGNKQPINGYRGDSNTLQSVTYRFAVGNDIDRSLYDLPGGVEVVEEFLKLLIEDYLYWSDRIAREAILSAAGAPAAPKTYPAIYATNGTTGLAMVIQGILAVKARKTDQRRDTPTFAVVNDITFEQMAYAAGGEQNLPAFIQLALSSLELPQALVGSVGPVQVVNGDTGITNTPSAIVGARLGIDFDELNAETPLIIDAVDIARGGIDKAVHGYAQVFTKRPEAFVAVGTPDNWTANQTVAAGSLRKNGAATLQATNSGTTSGTAPTNPAVGANVTDGTVVWRRLV